MNEEQRNAWLAALDVANNEIEALAIYLTHLPIINIPKLVQPPKTVCSNCKHFDSNGGDPSIWYNQYCLSSLNETFTNPVTGEKESVDGKEYKHCRDVNHGDCDLYEKKSVVTQLMRK